MQNLFKLAQENGWVDNREVCTGDGVCTDVNEKAYLDPLFFQALGKAMGWEKVIKTHVTDSGNKLVPVFIPSWHYQWLRFIDHLAEGKQVDDFFNDLLK